MLKSFNYKDLFSRNLGILTTTQQKRLQKSCVAIAGVGGVGGNQAIALVRAGIREFHIADPEVFRISDRNRQYGSGELNHNKNKAIVIKKMLEDINPDCIVKVFEKGVGPNNINEFLQGADVVIDAIEYFALPEKRMLYFESKKRNKYVFTCPIIGFGTSLLIFSPKGLSFEEYFEFDKKKKIEIGKVCPKFPGYLNEKVYKDATEGKRSIPSISTAAMLSGAVLATEIILFLSKKIRPITIPDLINIDLYNKKIEVFKKEWRDFWSSFSKESYQYITRLSEYEKMNKKIVSWVGENKKVLDAGCGIGFLAAKLAIDNSVLGVDYSNGMVRKAQRNTKGLKSVVITQGDVTDLKAKDGSFDVVTSVNVFFNLSEPDKAVREIRRVLKDKGVFIVSSMMNTGGLTKKNTKRFISDCKKSGVSESELGEVLKYQQVLLEKGGFQFRPSLNQMCIFLEKRGFEIKKKEIVYFGSNFLIKAKKRKN